MTTEWTIQTDEECATEKSFGAIVDRYIVSHPVYGMVESANTKGEAFELGDRYEMRTMPDGSLFCGEPYHVEVYDRMARFGKAQKWRRTKRDVYKFEHGDKYSRDGFWKVVECRKEEATESES